MTSGAGCCNSVVILGCVHCFFRFGLSTVPPPL